MLNAEDRMVRTASATWSGGAPDICLNVACTTACSRVYSTSRKAAPMTTVLLLLAISTVVMGAAFLLVLYTREQAVVHATLRQMSGAPPDQVADAVRTIRSSAFNIDIFPGIVIIYLKACLLAALSLFVSTFA